MDKFLINPTETMESILIDALNDAITQKAFKSASTVLESVRSTFSKYDEYKQKLEEAIHESTTIQA
jgi:DNA-binding protein YbaB